MAKKTETDVSSSITNPSGLVSQMTGLDESAIENARPGQIGATFEEQKAAADRIAASVAARAKFKNNMGPKGGAR